MGVKRSAAERGMSLVEATVILMVVSILAAVLAPSARAYIEDGRNTKAKKDVEAIGGVVDQLLRDTGMRCLSFNGSSCANDTSGRVELLVSGSSVSANEPTVLTSATGSIPASTASAASISWGGDPVTEVANNRRDLMDNQFVRNTPNYAAPSFTVGGGPRTGVGWRGAYIDGPVDVDPWGYAYQVSTLFLAVATDAPAGTDEGERRGGWTRDVVVVSAGSNGVIQTPFGSATTIAVGDDVTYVIQGGTR